MGQPISSLILIALVFSSSALSVNHLIAPSHVHEEADKQYTGKVVNFKNS